MWCLDLVRWRYEGAINRSATATAIRNEHSVFAVRDALDSRWLCRATSSVPEVRIEFAAPNENYCVPILSRAQKEKSAQGYSPLSGKRMSREGR